MPKHLSKPSNRAIAAFALDSIEPYFEAGVLDGNEADAVAVALADTIAEQIGRPPGKAFARACVLLGIVERVGGCRCQLCRY